MATPQKSPLSIKASESAAPLRKAKLHRPLQRLEVCNQAATNCEPVGKVHERNNQNSFKQSLLIPARSEHSVDIGFGNIGFFLGEFVCKPE